jgi:hypothetical protein
MSTNDRSHDRDRVITFRVNAEERATINTVASLRGQTISDFLRDAALAAGRDDIETLRGYTASARRGGPIIQIPAQSMLSALSLLLRLPVISADNIDGLHHRSCAGCLGAATSSGCKLGQRGEAILRFGTGDENV